MVRGLGRHLELKELAQRKAEEKAERERKAFLTNVSSHASSKLYTVPVPFQLSSNDKKHQVWEGEGEREGEREGGAPGARDGSRVLSSRVCVSFVSCAQSFLEALPSLMHPQTLNPKP